MNLYALARPLLFALDAEQIHELTIHGLSCVKGLPSIAREADVSLPDRPDPNRLDERNWRLVWQPWGPSLGFQEASRVGGLGFDRVLGERIDLGHL